MQCTTIGVFTHRARVCSNTTQHGRVDVYMTYGSTKHHFTMYKCFVLHARVVDAHTQVCMASSAIALALRSDSHKRLPCTRSIDQNNSKFVLHMRTFAFRPKLQNKMNNTDGRVCIDTSPACTIQSSRAIMKQATKIKTY
jgi:hypothetical protein